MPYRNDQASLEARRDDLRNDIADLTRKAEAFANAVRDKQAAERELADVEARLARTSKTRRSLLDGVRIASPCNADWEDMVGDERVRFCGSCQKNVFNLSALPADEAERLLAEREGSICVRLYRRADGTVLTADCPVGVRKKRVKRAALSLAGAGALAAAAYSAVSATRRPVMMGAVSADWRPPGASRELTPDPSAEAPPPSGPAAWTAGAVGGPSAPQSSPPQHVERPVRASPKQKRPMPEMGDF